MTDKSPAAFPRGKYGTADNDGMTLRQYYAGQALVSMGQWTPDDPSTDWGTPEAPVIQRKAEWAFEMADAMIAAEQVSQ
jgi:hypothetical protein